MPTSQSFAAALPRLFLVLLLAMGSTIISGCLASKVKRTIPYLPVGGAAYFNFAIHFDWLPDWYRLYSVLPGQGSACDDSNEYLLPADNRRVAIINCSVANAAQTASFAYGMQQTIDFIEARFGRRIHVTRASFTLIPPKKHHLQRSSQLLHPQGLRFEIAVRFNPDEPQIFEIDAVRSTSHELYHMIMVALPVDLGRDTPSELPEEVRASIFESCIEQEVYGSVLHANTFDVSKQFELDENHIADQAYVHESVAGNQRATRILRKIAGTDQSLSSDVEQAQFQRLCDSLIY